MGIKELKEKIKQLERENQLLKDGFSSIIANGNTVSVPEQFKPLFDDAEDVVAKYFEQLKADPTQGMIEINDERYVLLRASSLSVDFLTKIKDLYSDKGEKEAFAIGRNFLFDIAHVIGLEDAKNFHSKMDLKDPIAKLSAGPIHFAYTGWAYVDILPESNPSPDEDYFMKYHHPYSFEADSWIKSGIKSDSPVCIMNAGYSSGWCEKSFGIDLTAVEISCRAMGHENCTFIMAPPHMIDKHISHSQTNQEHKYEVPLFFERKKAEEKIKQSLDDKEVLLKEIHHRVKNNLQIVSSLLSLESNYLKDDNTKFLFKESQNRIKTMALVHEKLYKSSDIKSVNMHEYIASIIDLLSYSYDKEFIDVEYLFDKENTIQFDIDTAIPCGLIINEIVSNTFKYAFPKQLSGKITIDFKVNEGACELMIKDDGVGISEKIDVYNSNSLGLELIHSLVNQLEGDVKVNISNGTAFIIKFAC